MGIPRQSRICFRATNRQFVQKYKRLTSGGAPPEEIADELGLSLTTVYNLLRKGKLPWVKIGRKWFILREKIERLG